MKGLYKPYFVVLLYIELISSDIKTMLITSLSFSMKVSNSFKISALQCPFWATWRQSAQTMQPFLTNCRGMCYRQSVLSLTRRHHRSLGRAGWRKQLSKLPEIQTKAITEVLPGHQKWKPLMCWLFQKHQIVSLHRTIDNDVWLLRFVLQS